MSITNTSFKNGHLVSQETRDKISKSLIGNNNGSGHIVSEYSKELMRNKATGRKHSEETKKKLSLFFKGKKVSGSHRKVIIDNHPRGKRHPNYKHGLSKTSKYLTLKTKVRKYRLKAAGELSHEKIQMVYEDNIKKYGTLTCYLCLKKIDFGMDSLEHKIPIIRNGTNDYENLEIAHHSCNSRKGNKTYEEYMVWNG